MSQQKDLIAFLQQHVTEKRYNLFKKVVQNRTRYISVMLEDIYQSQNASAVLRSCDCFGIQDVHIVENRNEFDVNPNVSLGSSKWLTLNKYNRKEQNTFEAIQNLKNKGYRIVATSPHTNDTKLDDFDLEKGKAAFIFGTEMQGISQTVKEHADEFLKIPMYGFTESFNISVSAAIVIHSLTNKMHQSKIDWKLTESERDELMISWLRTTIKGSDLLIQEYKNRR